MFKPKTISLKNSFSILIGIQLVLIVGLGVMIFLLYQNQNRLAKSRDTNFNSYLLADELRQSSDDLTQMARAYVATGKPEFESRYWMILDIRNGTRPRPLSYNRIYWDLVVTPGQKPRADGPAISLHDLMVKEGFTAAEFNELTLAQSRSDGLVKTELTAMNAVKGLFDDGSGNFTVKKEPDIKLANELMNNEAYYQMKAAIMQPIDDFYNLFQKRTTEAVTHYLHKDKTLFVIVIFLVSVILLISITSYGVLQKQIVEREQADALLAEANKNLDNQVKIRTKNLERSETELKKALAIAEQTNKLMVGRELAMIELKKQLSKK
jgi:methyl-accepting chemotaxis protein